MINEHKKNRRAVKYNIKPRNFVAKNATTGGAGEHRDKSKEIPRSAKHKNKEMDMSEEWTQKYKSSINCSHPKGFSQRAHCQGKKKHNESMEMEMTCEDCGMCQTHGSLNEIAKGAKDSNGVTKCWPGKHAAGTKTGKNGGQVRNCVPNESVAEGRKPFRDLKSWTDHAKSQGLKVSEPSNHIDWTHDATDKQGNVRGRFVRTRVPQNSRGFIHQQDMAEGYLNEDIMGAPRPEDNHEASMALSELYRNAKYAMALLKIIEPNDAIDGWVQANLTSAADMLDKVGHYLDYKNINGRKPEVDMDEDDNVDDTDVGEADGSMARENLQIIVEYSIKLMEMIKPGDNLASWVSMKLTKASEAISSAKHFIEYRQFEKHASDAFESKLTRMLAQQLSETMSPASNFAGSKKNKLGSAGQLKGNMKRPARAGDLVGGAAESVSEDDEAMRNFLAKGGKIQHVKPQKGPKSPGLSYGSRHIGASGGRGSSKGKVSGLGASTHKSSSKPVVTAEQVDVDAHPTDSGDYTYSINGKPVEPGSDLHNSIKDQHMDQVSPIYKPLKQMMSQPTDQSMGADPRKDSENDVQPNDVIIPSHPKGHWVKVRDIGETDNEKPKTVAKTWDEMSSKEKLSGVKGRTVWNPKTQKYRTVFDMPAQSKK